MPRGEFERAALSKFSQNSWVRLDLVILAPRIPLIVTPTGRSDDWGMLVAGRLDSDSGYVVLEEELAGVIPSREGRDSLDILRDAIKSLRRPGRLNQPILTMVDVGYGIGIDFVNLTVGEAKTLHAFRRNRRKRMSAEDVAWESKDEYNEVNSKQTAIVRKHIHSLRDKEAHGRTYRIDTYGRWENKGYEYSEIFR